MTAEDALPSAQSIDTPQEADGQQLNQASDTTAVLQDELIQAAERERQLQMQMDKMKDDVSQLQMRLEQLSNLQKEFDDFKRRSAPVWEQAMKQCDSRFICSDDILGCC